MTHCLGQKKICKTLLQINSSYFSKIVLHNSRNETRASLRTKEFRCKTKSVLLSNWISLARMKNQDLKPWSSFTYRV